VDIEYIVHRAAHHKSLMSLARELGISDCMLRYNLAKARVLKQVQLILRGNLRGKGK
jgi:hypothetical protein